jgi:hypothetical protein
MSFGFSFGLGDETWWMQEAPGDEGQIDCHHDDN